jgi:hypothetical protein
MVGGPRAAGTYKDIVEGDDRLSQYGRIQVVMKDSVKDKSTMTVGDSLDQRGETAPTPLSNIGADSIPNFGGDRRVDPSAPMYGGLNRAGLYGDILANDWPPDSFKQSSYYEVQIHGLQVADIHHVILPSKSKGLTDALDAAGITWEVRK